MKFSAPISVLRLLNPDEKAVSTSVLLSSTIGPAAIWTLHLVDGEVLVWKIATILLNSEIYDAIITGTISRDYIFIGTYGEVRPVVKHMHNSSQMGGGGKILSSIRQNCGEMKV